MDARFLKRVGLENQFVRCVRIRGCSSREVRFGVDVASVHRMETTELRGSLCKVHAGVRFVDRDEVIPISKQCRIL